MKKIIFTVLITCILIVLNPSGNMSVVNATNMVETAEEMLKVEGLGKITTDTLNVRSGPGTDYNALGKVYSTDTVRIIGQVEDWYKIVYDGTEGFVSAEYVEVISMDVLEEETISEEASIDETEPIIEEAAGEKKPLLTIVVIAIIVVCVMMVGTIIALKVQSDDDEEDDIDDEDDYDEDNYDEDDYDEDDYGGNENVGKDYTKPGREDYTVVNFDEVKYVEPENSDSEDYRIHIDPDFFDQIRNE